MFYILGSENSINMKLKLGLRNENITLIAKSQVYPTTCCPERELHFANWIIILQMRSTCVKNLYQKLK